MSLALGVGGFAIGAVLQLLVVIGLHMAARRAAERNPSRYARFAVAIPWLGLAAACVGLAVTSVGLWFAFDAVANAPADRRASSLAEGISTAMNGTGVGLSVSIALYLFSALSSLGVYSRAPQRR